MGAFRIDDAPGLRVLQQEILAELGACALRDEPPDILLQQAVRLVARGLPAEFCAILQLQPPGEPLLVRAGVGWPDGAAAPTTLGADLAAAAFAAICAGHAVTSSRFANDDRPAPSRPPAASGPRRTIDVVISGDVAPFGVLEAGSDLPGEYGPADLGFMQAAANMLGVALERGRAAAALADAQSRTRDILESISDSFYALDHDFRFTYLNRKCEEWCGLSREAALGKVIWEVFPQAVGSEVQASHLRAARERRKVSTETLSSLRPRWLEFTIFPGEAGLAVYFRDIDDRKRAEVALRESEARLRFATESAGLGTWEVDLASGRILRSAQHAAIFGVDPSVEWSHPEFLRHVVPEDRAMADRVRMEALAIGGEWCITCRIRRTSDGALRWVEARGAPVPEASGEIRRYIGIITDVTARKETEAARLREAEELERRVFERTCDLARTNVRLTEEIAERRRAEAALVQSQRLEAIGQLVGGVAHSFNNLLAAVIGNLELLGPDLPGERPRRLLDRALHAAWRGSWLTQQLLAYARKQNLEPRPLDTNAELDGMLEALRRGVGDRTRIETALAPGAWPTLGDPAQLRLVMLALTLNAHDAMPGGGALRIATRNVRAGDPALPAALAGGEFVLLSIADEGSGMSPDVLARACEPFFTTKDVGKGNGLGLAQVEGVVLQFGGAVRLRSVVGVGTTVELFLPRAAELVLAGGHGRDREGGEMVG